MNPLSMFKMFTEDNGNVSSTRIMTFIIVVCCMADYMFSTFTKGQWKPSPEIITVLLGSLGLKVGQKFAESKSTKKDPVQRKPRAKKAQVKAAPVVVSVATPAVPRIEPVVYSPAITNAPTTSPDAPFKP